MGAVLVDVVGALARRLACGDMDPQGSQRSVETALVGARASQQALAQASRASGPVLKRSLATPLRCSLACQGARPAISG